MNNLKLNPVVKPIIVDRKKLSDLREKLLSPHLSSNAKYAAIKKVVGGVCSRCEDIPTKMLSYDVQGAEVIEKYCDRCFKKWTR